ncbi:MAG: hypothetical protein FJ109_06075, partial [Deltaproteobacteria bacterium]|nr:hypothetical protein [Deltaproteobacteria bacterium]
MSHGSWTASRGCGFLNGSSRFSMALVRAVVDVRAFALALLVASGCSGGREPVLSPTADEQGENSAPALSDGSLTPNETRGEWTASEVDDAPFPDDVGDAERAGDQDGDGVGWQDQDSALEDSAAEVPCVPSCPGDCGPDGCGGSCGECVPGALCVDGTCGAAAPCQSSKDCEGGVCDKAQGVCVECIEDVDCTGGFRCSGGVCVEAPDCLSDKDCKAYGMVCDKQAGYCVGCLADPDCADEQG